MKTNKQNIQHELLKNRIDYRIYGSQYIEEGARHQMEIAMKLPVTVAGALMPDAHQGYGLPIGGVLATRNAVIPYGVGVDIGCRMALSVYSLDWNKISDQKRKMSQALGECTVFGAGQEHKKLIDHEVLN